MTKLVAHLPVGTDTTTADLDGPIGTIGDIGGTVAIDSETLTVVAGHGSRLLVVDRGSSPAAHAVGASVSYSSPTGSGGVSVTDGTTTVNPATQLTFPSSGVVAGGAGEAVVHPQWTVEESTVQFVSKAPGASYLSALILFAAGGDMSDATAKLQVNDGAGANAAEVLLDGVAGSIAITGTTLTWNGDPIGTQAAHLANGSTVDQLLAALIASGLMAAP